MNFLRTVAFFTMAQLQALLPTFLWMLAGSAVLFLWLFWLARTPSLETQKFKVLGLFYGLGNGERIHLACVLLRWLFLVVCIVQFKQLTLSHHFLFWLLTVAGVALCGKLADKVAALINGILAFATLVACNLLCSYLLERRFDMFYFVIYILMGTFVILLASYIFLQEIDEISGRRCANGKELEE